MEPEPELPAPGDRPYLVSPLEGWSGPMDPRTEEVLARGFAAVEKGRAEEARAAARELGGGELPAAGEASAPALVLTAQADLLDRRPADAVARLRPVAEEHPAYTALQLLLGRAAESAGDLVTSFAAFHRIADTSLAAYDRVEEMRPRVAEVLANRVEEALRRGEPGRAEEPLERLRSWAPELPATWEAAAALAGERGDRQAELAAVRELAALRPDEPQVMERRAELELAVGEPKAGLDLYERLAERDPGDAALAERLAYAKFRWRVSQMPPRVERVASALELERGDLAVLLYWLVPRVRSERGGQARIASDILDDPRREEIARVVNLGLMEVDLSVHRFFPERPVDRGEALAALLRVLERFGPAPCAAAVEGRAGSAEAVCSGALACRLVRADEACLPTERLSGARAVELIRRALARLETLRGGG